MKRGRVPNLPAGGIDVPWNAAMAASTGWSPVTISRRPCSAANFFPCAGWCCAAGHSRFAGNRSTTPSRQIPVAETVVGEGEYQPAVRSAFGAARSTTGGRIEGANRSSPSRGSGPKWRAGGSAVRRCRPGSRQSGRKGPSNNGKAFTLGSAAPDRQRQGQRAGVPWRVAPRSPVGCGVFDGRRIVAKPRQAEVEACRSDAGTIRRTRPAAGPGA